MRRAAATAVATTALTVGLAGPTAGVALATVGTDQEARYPGTVVPGGEEVRDDRQTVTTPGGEVRDNRQTVTTPGGEVRDNRQTVTTPARTDRPRVADTRQTLPFTGGELVVLVTAGAGAVGAGAALVVATRRRGQQSA